MTAIILFIGLGLQELLVILFSIGFLILIFLASRAFFLWYWKVNVIIENQERQIDLLSKLVQERGVTSGYGNPTEVAEKAVSTTK
jgi:hypothetical protein